jgi:hypothetical protein
MKAQILKIAGVKSEKEFYKKYPSEEAFMKVHGKAFKKAQIGAYIGGNNTTNPKPISYQTYYDDVDKLITGSTEKERQEAAYKAEELKATKEKSSGMKDLLGMIKSGMGDAGSEPGDFLPEGEEMMGGGGSGEAITSMFGGARYGKYIPKAQNSLTGNIPAMQTTGYAFGGSPWGTQGVPSGVLSGQPAVGTLTGGTQISASQAANQPVVSNATVNQTSQEGPGFLDKAMSAIPVVGSIFGGIKALGAEKEAAKAAKQQKTVSGLQLTASATRPEETQRRYVRPEDVTIQPNQMFPTYGVGTNVLARDGRFIKRAQDGTIETPQIDAAPTDWYEEGMDKDTYYALKQQLDDAGYQAIPKPESVNVRDMQAITEEEPDPNQMSEEQAASFMEMYNRDQGISTSTFDSKSARDNWVQKTGLPWSEAKRLGYTSGSAKDNTKLLNELKDPRFRKENLRTEAPKKSSQTRTPVQHRETPTGKLTPIKKPLTMDEYFKGKPKYTKDQGEIRMPDEGTMIDRVGERLANPLQTLAHLAKYKELPARGFSKNDKNAYDQVIGVANPFYWANALGNAADYTEQGEYSKAAWEALDAAPALGKIKYTKYIPFNKGLPPASVRRAGYLGEGAKRLKAAPAKQLPAAKPKMLKQPFTPNFVMYQDGGEIQNTYAPDYLYDDLGYEPLNDSNVKQYYHGGGIPKAQGGFSNYASTLGGGGSGFSGAGAGGGTPWGAIGGIGSSMANSVAGGGNAGGQIGGGIGEGVGAIFGPAGMAIGKTLGTAVGNAVDPYAKAIKRDTAATKRNIENTAYNNMAPGFIAPYEAHARDGGSIPNYEEGGYMNPEYNPQLITMFGDHTAEDFADYAHKYRAGGHLKSYTPPSERAMETYAMGGQLQTHWGGGAETMSYNPYSAGSGEMVKFNGQSHTESDREGNTGIGITYGDSPVEVERGEPMFEMEAGGEINPETGKPETTGVVFGNMKVDKKIVGQLNDPDLMEIANRYHGKKFKNIGIDLAKQEVKQNKIIDKNIKMLDPFKVQTSLDKAKLAAIQANMEGADAKLRNIANTKITLANYQNAINDTKDELSDVIGQNLSAEDLARGYVKLDKDPVTMNAKWGGNIIKKAQNGTTLKSYPNDAAAKADGFTWTGEYKSDGKTKIYQKTIKTTSNVDTEAKTADALGYIPAGQKYDPSTGLHGKVTQEALDAARKANPWFDWTGFDPKDKNDVKNYQRAFNARAKALGSSAQIKDDGDFGEQTASARIDESKKSTPSETQEVVRAIVEAPAGQPQEEEKAKTPWWAMAANTILPYIRPTDQEAFDYAQLYPEMYALGSNQLEPVPVQGYRPDLATPYDISYQDMLNANQADYNASQKMVGYNPAAQSFLNAQKYAANEKVLGEQFRANQAMQAGVYDQNRQTLNDAKLKNLAIFDRQYERQAEAKSNTKATTQAALNSMADKYAKHKLENRTLGVYENMYNYRFDKNGRAQNYNPLQIFDTQMGGGKSKNDGDIPGLEATRWDRNGNPIAWKKASDKKTVTDDDLEASGGILNKNGGYTKIKSKNGSILREFKNL